ncbi:hypothetical protein E2C01_102641 [Portunus trituberculatus]|uniref:Uncharacterized protein n=1 Tax=Portunus trituberculatus TaxID=210409 RepID=A0A5B7KDU2_PORTR|nr:hypothetical protein [Portunus trituberculatus]
MQQKYVPQKNSQNRRLLRKVLVEGNPPSHSDLKMTSRGPEQLHKRLAPGAIENHLLRLQREGALAAMDGVPRLHADQSF